MDAPLHDWNLAPKEAVALQTVLAKRLETTNNGTAIS